MPDSPTPVVELAGVTKSYPGGVTALRDVSLRVRPGEVFGIIGESGAGKSTLLDVLTGATRPTSGTARVLGHDPATRDRAAVRRLRRELGVVFQGVHLLANRTVRQNVALPLRLRGAAAADAAATDMLDFVGLAGRTDDYPARLSGGQRQRVGIARALVASPRLLLCDEPTSSLDAGTTAGVLALLRDVRDRLGTTVVVVTHDLAVVQAVCDRVALFEDGVLRDVLAVHAEREAADESYLDRARRVLGA